MNSPKIIFYDSECATCHRLVLFLLRRKRKAAFLFVPLKALLESPRPTLLDARGQALTGDSIVVLRHGLFQQRSDAVFSILQSLGSPWTLLLVLLLIPRSIRDFLYELFARHRYRIMGRVDPDALCERPEASDRRLFRSEIPDEADFFRAGE